MLPPQKITIQPTAFPEEPSGTYAREGPPPAPAGDSGTASPGPGSGSLWHAVLDINKSRSDMCLESCPFLPKALGRGCVCVCTRGWGQGASVGGDRGGLCLGAEARGSFQQVRSWTPGPRRAPPPPSCGETPPKLLAGGVDPPISSSRPRPGPASTATSARGAHLQCLPPPLQVCPHLSPRGLELHLTAAASPSPRFQSLGRRRGLSVPEGALSTPPGEALARLSPRLAPVPRCLAQTQDCTPFLAGASPPSLPTASRERQLQAGSCQQHRAH